MSRLYGAKVDYNRWEIIETDNENYHSYKLVDKNSKEIYYLYHIIGVEQVNDDEFLVFRKSYGDDFEIVRYKLENSKYKKIFLERFSRFDFITDDRILFSSWGNNGSCYCTGIYSIKDNSLLKEADWLYDTSIDVYKDNETLNNIKLYVEKEIYSYRLNNPKLIFTVDPNTLQPNSDCYSQLRDSYLKVNSVEDIERIKTEDSKSIEIIEEQMRLKEQEQLKNAKQKVLVRTKEIK